MVWGQSNPNACRVRSVRYASYRMDLDQIGDQSGLDPVPGARGMKRPHGMKVGMLEFDPTMPRSFDVGKRRTELGRSQKWCILEWARLTWRS